MSTPTNFVATNPQNDSGSVSCFGAKLGATMRTIALALFVVVLWTEEVMSQSYVWEQVNHRFGGLTFYDVDFPNQDTGFVAAPPFVLRSIDAGRTWHKFELPLLTASHPEAVSFPTGRVGYAAGSTILKTTDAGETWTRMQTVLNDKGGASHISSMDFGSEDNGWLMGTDWTTFYRTSDGAASLERRVAPCGACASVRYVNDSSVFVVGWGSSTFGMLGSLFGVAGYRPHGWSNFPRAAVDLEALDVEVASMRHIWVAGRRARRSGTQEYSNHIVFTHDDGATPWKEPITKLPWPVTAIAFVDTLRGFIGDEAGDMYGTSDGGFTWAREYKGNAKQPIKDIAVKGNTIIAVGDYSLILRRSELVSVAEDVPTHHPTIRLYPNPTTGAVTVEPGPGPAQLIDVDVLGTVVMQLPAESKTTIDLSAFPPGMYRVIAQTSSAVRSETVAVVR